MLLQIDILPLLINQCKVFSWLFSALSNHKLYGSDDTDSYTYSPAEFNKPTFFCSKFWEWGGFFLELGF